MLWHHVYTTYEKVQHYCSACYMMDVNDSDVCHQCQTTRPLPFIGYHNRSYCLVCYRKRRLIDKKKENECLFITPTKEKIIEKLSHDDDAVYRLFVSLIKTG